MDRQRNLLLATAAVVTGGLASWWLLTPQASRTRQLLARHTRAQTQWLETRLHEIEAQLNAVEAQLQAGGHQLTRRVQAVRHRALDPYLPDFDGTGEDWDLDRSDVGHDLPRLPGA